MGEKLHAIVAYEEYTRSYGVRYVSKVRHLGLEKIRVLKDLNKFILQTKVRSVLKVWDEQWERQESQLISQLTFIYPQNKKIKLAMVI